MAFAGGNIIDVIKKYGKRINHFHAKDVRSDIIHNLNRGKESFLDAVLKGAFTVPGDGSLNYIDIINNLKNVGYEGWFVVEAEQDPKICPPLEYAKIGYKSLSDCLIRAGYEIDNNILEK